MEPPHRRAWRRSTTTRATASRPCSPPLSTLAGCRGLAAAAPCAADRVLACVRGAYRAMAAAARGAADGGRGGGALGRTELRPAFQRAVDGAHKLLAPAVATLLHEAENAGGGGGGGGRAAKAPDVVFAVEDFEARLIRLGVAARVNLMRGARRAVARDFRIGGALQAQAAAQQQQAAAAAAPGGGA